MRELMLQRGTRYLKFFSYLSLTAHLLHPFLKLSMFLSTFLPVPALVVWLAACPHGSTSFRRIVPHSA